MTFKDKVIFIISYENWGHMLMSKHHYAIELGKAGNKVYFINHPDKRKELARGEIKVETTKAKNVFAVSHRLLHPYFLKFKFTALYNFFIQRHIRKMIKAIGQKPDVVWSFDTGNTIPLKYFPKKAFKIFMPVDGPFGHKHEMASAESANLIISVTQRILNTFKDIKVPNLLVNHGVANVFLDNEPGALPTSQIRVGYSGSLVRSDLDFDLFLKIINAYPEIIFEFWGEFDYKKSNIHLPQDITNRTREFLDTLHSLPNVIMHGPVSTEVLAEGLRRMDCLLICYSIKNDQNHHKVLEYLGTGNVIVSNYLSSYSGEESGLLVMANNPDNNKEIPALFDSVVKNLTQYNSDEKRAQRIAYARRYSYASNISRIEDFIAKSKSS